MMLKTISLHLLETHRWDTKVPSNPIQPGIYTTLISWVPSTLLSRITINCFSSVSYSLPCIQHKAKIRSLPRGVLHAKQMVNDTRAVTALVLVGDDI